MPDKPENKPASGRTYQEDEYFDVGEELARSWAEIEAWKRSIAPAEPSPEPTIPEIADCAPNSIGRNNPTVGDLSGGTIGRTIGGE